MRSIVVACALVLLLCAPVAAQTTILEAETGNEVLAPCQWFHRSDTCDIVHIDFVVPLSTGGTLQVDGRPYVLEWQGPGYYLDSGVVLEPLDGGVPGLQGQRWLEVYPQQGRIRVSEAWQDSDGNQALSVNDSLTLDAGRALRVRDVRLNLRVRPAPPVP